MAEEPSTAGETVLRMTGSRLEPDLGHSGQSQPDLDRTAGQGLFLSSAVTVRPPSLRSWSQQSGLVASSAGFSRQQFRQAESSADIF